MPVVGFVGDEVDFAQEPDGGGIRHCIRDGVENSLLLVVFQFANHRRVVLWGIWDG